MSLINTPPIRIPFQDKDGIVSREWINWSMQAFRLLFAGSQSGITADRPITNLYIGRPYYDTTLGYSIHVHQVTPSVVWHNGAGLSV